MKSRRGMNVQLFSVLRIKTPTIPTLAVPAAASSTLSFVLASALLPTIEFPVAGVVFAFYLVFSMVGAI
jgi:hypothetical protein